MSGVIDSWSWLREVKAGDLVIAYVGWGASVREVAKVTATQVVIVSENGVEYRFDRKSGSMRGSSNYSRARIEKATPEKVDKVRRASLAQQLAYLKPEAWEKLPLADLERITAIVDSIPAAT